MLTKSMLDAMPLFNGLDGRQRAKLQNAMAERLVPRGAEILGAGDTADELVLILHGSASILVPSPDGEMVRLAGVRCGGIVGEIAFLDQEPRSASVVAQEDVVAAVLSRETYNALCETEPQLVRQLLANIALDVATRLRRTNQLALARTGVR